MKRTIEMILMTLLIVMAAAFVGSTLISCSSDDDDNGGFVGNETTLIGKWSLVDVENGPGSLGGGDQTWREEIPSSYVIEFKSDGTMSMPEECATTPAQHHYVFLKDTEHYPSTFPVVLIDEVPFGYAFENNKLRLHYEGAYTCDHIPATFVFQRFSVKFYD